MGSEGPEAWPQNGEGPIREITLSPFAIAPTAVTNAEFAAFVEATGYVTEAERFGWSFVFHLLLSRRTAQRATQGAAAAPWWRVVERASWRHPEGPDSTIDKRDRHPVTHVSHNDAVAYCAWAGARLPTEAQWEYAARGGLESCRYPWGDEPPDADGNWRCNIFQGEFPDRDTAEDGYRGTAPVDAFEPNGHGLYNTIGNVWEWTADWHTTRHTRRPRTDPTGPSFGTERVTRGGSYLCHDSYCNRYRTSARMALTPDSSTGNTGFRCARLLRP
jgi:sulfatase modifying factor 1